VNQDFDALVLWPDFRNRRGFSSTDVGCARSRSCAYTLALSARDHGQACMHTRPQAGAGGRPRI